MFGNHKFNPDLMRKLIDGLSPAIKNDGEILALEKELRFAF